MKKLSIIQYTLSLILISAVLSAATPDPLSLGESWKKAKMIEGKGEQIEKIILSKEDPAPPIVLKQNLGGAYSIAFWLYMENTPKLKASKFTEDTPLTIIDFHSNPISAQRVVMRISSGNFAATTSINNKWSSFSGMRVKAEPGKWHFIVFTYEKGKARFYINGTIAMQAPDTSFRYDRVKNIVFGNFGRSRCLDGVILKPRIYPEVLSTQEVEAMFKDKPEAIK